MKNFRNYLLDLDPSLLLEGDETILDNVFLTELTLVKLMKCSYLKYLFFMIFWILLRIFLNF